MELSICLKRAGTFGIRIAIPMESGSVFLSNLCYHYDNGFLLYYMDSKVVYIYCDLNNNPQQLNFADSNITKYMNSFSGQKLRTIHYTVIPNISVPFGEKHELSENEILCADSTDYLLGGTLLLKNGKVDKYLFNGGYCQNTDSTLAFYYFNQDHLGNNREVVNEEGKVVQNNNYYPFGTPFYDEANTTNDYLQPFKYNGKELDMMHGLNTYDYGARQYYAALPVWDRIDPLCEEEYRETSPYTYCANNPINCIDHDGKEIWISYYDENNKLQRLQYTIGMCSDISNKNVQTIIKNLNQMAQNDSGKEILNDLVDSSIQYSFQQTNTISSDEANGYWDSKTKTVYLQDPSNTLTFAEETFHIYQYENGRGGSYAVNEVEAKLFSAKMNYEIDGWDLFGAAGKIAGSNEFGHTGYADAMQRLLYKGYSPEDFSYAVHHFLTDTLGRAQYIKSGYSVGKIYSEPLIKKFLPIKDPK